MKGQNLGEEMTLIRLSCHGSLRRQTVIHFPEPGDQIHDS